MKCVWAKSYMREITSVSHWKGLLQNACNNHSGLGITIRWSRVVEYGVESLNTLVRSKVQQIKISAFTHSDGNSDITMLSINSDAGFRCRMITKTGEKVLLVRRKINKGEGKEICLHSPVDMTLFTNVVFPFLFFFTVPSLFASIA